MAIAQHPATHPEHEPAVTAEQFRERILVTFAVKTSEQQAIARFVLAESGRQEIEKLAKYTLQRGGFHGAVLLGARSYPKYTGRQGQSLHAIFSLIEFRLQPGTEPLYTTLSNGAKPGGFMAAGKLSVATGTPVPATPDREQQFRTLVALWKRERGPHSSSAKLAEHPAYQQIIHMGPEVIPWLLRELEQEPDHWFRALHALTGMDPVPVESRGKIREMAEAWLQWGRATGYEW